MRSTHGAQPTTVSHGIFYGLSIGETAEKGSSEEDDGDLISEPQQRRHRPGQVAVLIFC